MKLKVIRTSEVEIDMEREYERIETCDFSKEQRKRILQLYEMFGKEKYRECYEFLDTWGRCPRLECPEVEFIHPLIHDVILSGALNKNVRIYKVPEPPQRPESKMTRHPERGEYISFWDTSYPALKKGWVGRAVPESDYYEIQCDDGFKGERGVICLYSEMIEILPMKENPYKTRNENRKEETDNKKN